jgi:hypothetical protein
MGKITYCIVDETDPSMEFECEGKVIKTFFETSPVFDFDDSLELIQQEADIENELKKESPRLFNIFHFSAHGAYFNKNKHELDYSCIYRKRGKQEIEIFRPDTIVRAQLQADVFLSTCCQTFNEHFIETLKGYKEVFNFIAPEDEPLTGDTIVFSLMLYNELINQITLSQKEIKDKDIINAFKITNKAYKSYNGQGNFKLYNIKSSKIFK